MDNAIYDLATGGVNGVLAPVTNGLGNTVVKTIGSKLGLEIAGSETAKSAFKNVLLNQSIDVTGGTLKKRALAQGAGMAVDGSVSGGIYNGSTAIMEGKNSDEVLQASAEGFIGGLIGAPVIGGGFRTAGKLGRELGDNVFGTSQIKPKQQSNEHVQVLKETAKKEEITPETKPPQKEENNISSNDKAEIKTTETIENTPNTEKNEIPQGKEVKQNTETAPVEASSNTASKTSELSKEELIKKLENLKMPDGEPRFSYIQIHAGLIKNLSPEQIEKVCSEDFQNVVNTFENQIGNKLQIGKINELAKLEKNEFEMVKSILSDFKSDNSELLNISKLTPEELKKAEDFLFTQSNGSYFKDKMSAIKLLQTLPPEEAEKAKSLVYIPELRYKQLEPEQFERAKSLFSIPERENNQFWASEIAELSQLEPKLFEQALNLSRDEEIIPGHIIFRMAKKMKGVELYKENKELDETMNSLIQGIPEFINIIGKQQHKPHDYSLDIHILNVLKESMKNPEYDKLSPDEKICLKFAAVLHDISKTENLKDNEHPDISALYARDILNKGAVKMPAEYKNRIVELIKNHHWTELYNKEKISSDNIAAMFRRQGDLKIARIMAESDLKSIDSNQAVYNKFSNVFDKSMKAVDTAFELKNTDGQMFLTSKVRDLSKIPEIERSGQKYKVLNLRDENITNETDLSQFGFEKGTTIDNLRFFVHTSPNISGLENVYNLADANYQGLLCASYVSLKNMPTFKNNQFGVSLTAENVNIANAASFDQWSPMENRNLEGFSNFVTIKKEGTMSDRTPVPDLNSIKPPTSFVEFEKNKPIFRELIPSIIKEKLQISDEEYGELYNKIQNYEFAQILDDDIIEAGGKKFTYKEVKEAIREANDSALAIKNHHSEVNLYTPKVNAVIAKVNSFDEIPQELLDFANKHDLPMYIAQIIVNKC